MTTNIIQRKPERMSFSNLANATTLEAQFNPEELNEDLKAVWGEIPIAGLSHKPQNYEGTDNHVFSFKLQFAVQDSDGNKLADITFARRYLQSLFYARRGAQDIVGGAPPRFLFVWPNFISLSCVIHSMKMRHFHLGRDGQPYHFDADVVIKEIRDVRLFSEDVFFEGTFRSGVAAGDGDATT